MNVAKTIQVNTGYGEHSVSALAGCVLFFSVCALFRSDFVVTKKYPKNSGYPILKNEK